MNVWEDQDLYVECLKNKPDGQIYLLELKLRVGVGVGVAINYLMMQKVQKAKDTNAEKIDTLHAY
jgi:hypothetical protein